MIRFMATFLLLALGLIAPAFAALPTNALDALRKDSDLRHCYNHLRDLGVDDARSFGVASFLKQQTKAETYRRDCAGITAAEVGQLVDRAVRRRTLPDGTTQAQLSSQGGPVKTSYSVGDATTKTGAPVSENWSLLGERVPGIPSTFVGYVELYNRSSASQRFHGKDGTVLIVERDPAHYQYVVVVKGIELTLSPNERRKEPVWLMCIQNGIAGPPVGQALYVAGVLRPSIRDTLINYRDSTSSKLRFQTREQTIAMFRAEIEDIIK